MLAVAQVFVNFQAVVYSVISCALIIAHILQSLKTGGASKIFKHRLLVTIEMCCGMYSSTQLLLQKVIGPL